MTITEQLQFSVLTAPVASVDRRTLSQAWYSALYGNGNAGVAEKRLRAQPAAQISSEPPARGTARAAWHGPQNADGARANSAKAPVHAQGAPPDRRAPRSPLARKIERAFLRSPGSSHKASFTIDAEAGRVHVLLHARGAQLKLIAICPPKARSNVAAALAQARYALAMRGIDLDAQTRTQAPC